MSIVCMYPLRPCDCMHAHYVEWCLLLLVARRGPLGCCADGMWVWVPHGVTGWYVEGGAGSVLGGGQDGGVDVADEGVLMWYPISETAVEGGGGSCRLR